jgi:hypothetical protein
MTQYIISVGETKWPAHGWNVDKVRAQTRKWLKQWKLKGRMKIEEVSDTAPHLSGMFNDWVTVRLPFSGFGEQTLWNDLIDHEENSNWDYEVEYRQEEEGVPKHMRLDASEFCNLSMQHSNYSEAFEAIAKDYVEAFSFKASQRLGFDWDVLNLKFESLESRGDRVWAYMHPAVLHYLWVRSTVEDHKRLAVKVKAEFTPRSGFIPAYRSNVEAWVGKELDEWDHNELGMLLEAMIDADERDEDGEELDWSIYHCLADDNQYWSNCVDWPKLEAAVQEMRDEKHREWCEKQGIDTDIPPPPYRCTETPDFLKMEQH